MKKKPSSSTLNDFLVEESGDSPSGTREERSKNPQAVERGRKGGIVGGQRRSEALSPEERSRIASLAAKSRWKSKPSGIPSWQKNFLKLLNRDLKEKSTVHKKFKQHYKSAVEAANFDRKNDPTKRDFRKERIKHQLRLSGLTIEQIQPIEFNPEHQGDLDWIIAECEDRGLDPQCVKDLWHKCQEEDFEREIDRHNSQIEREGKNKTETNDTEEVEEVLLNLNIKKKEKRDYSKFKF